MTFEDSNKPTQSTGATADGTTQSGEQVVQNVHDLSSSMSTTNDDEMTSTPSSSQQSSPTKHPPPALPGSSSSEPISPSKSPSKSKRKRDAQRARKSGQKAVQNPTQQQQQQQQQQHHHRQQQEIPSTSSNQINKSERNNDSKVEEEQQRQESISVSTTGSSKKSQAHNVEPSASSIDSKQQSVSSTEPVSQPAPKESTRQAEITHTTDTQRLSPTLKQEANSGTAGEHAQGNGCNNETNTNTKTKHVHGHDSNSWWRRQQDNYKREMHNLREHVKIRDAKLGNYVEKLKSQGSKIKELETSLLSTTKTCNQFEKLLQQELTIRSRLETENESLNQMVTRLKSQISVHEKNKFESDELVRVLNATLMERETEISILKLKMTRMQTNPSSTLALNGSSSKTGRQDPQQAYATTGRSNSEFCRNSYIRSSMLAEAASTRNSTNQLKACDKDATVWAGVPEELTPSKRPLVLERHLQPLYGSSNYSAFDRITSTLVDDPTTPVLRGRNYRTMPRSMKSPFADTLEDNSQNLYMQPTANREELDNTPCKVTNLDDSSSTNRSASSSKPVDAKPAQAVTIQDFVPRPAASLEIEASAESLPQGSPSNAIESSHYSTIGNNNEVIPKQEVPVKRTSPDRQDPPSLPNRTPSTPVKLSGSLKKIFDKFRRSESDSNSNLNSKTDLSSTPTVTPVASPFKRGATRSTMANPTDMRSHLSTRRQSSFQTDKPFAEWDTDMLVEWLTMIGLSMYAPNCRRWVRCGAHIMNATPAEVDKGLGITNPIHRKKLRLAISELNGDCDKVTKAAAKLDYLWVARWLDDIGLPQYKEAFINARVDGRVLNYLTVDDLVSMNVKSLLHHASIKCGIKVLRSINFDLQVLKRRATAEEAEQMEMMRQQMNLVSSNANAASLKQSSDSGSPNIEVPLWTCHRVMEWLRMIDFAEFAPNLRGSGVHGGLLILEDGFNIDTMCSLLSIPMSRTLLRRHMSTFFEGLLGKELAERKRLHRQTSTGQQLNPLTEIRTPRKSRLWFSKLKSSKVAQDGAMDEYLCPMYPTDSILIRGQTTPHNRKTDVPAFSREGSQLNSIPESINV